MKKLNTNNTGRMPLWQADLDWLQQAYTEPIEAVIKELASTNAGFFPVTGCRVVISGGTIAMSAGWFWWDGELLPVRALAATSISGLANPVVWLRRVTHADPDGSRNFIQADQSAALVSDVWQDDYLRPEASAYTAPHTDGVLLKPGAWTLADRITRRANAESQWFVVPNVITPEIVQYKQIGRTVVLKGQALVRILNGSVFDMGLPTPLGGKAWLVTGKRKAHYVQNNYEYLPIDGELYVYVSSTGGLVVAQRDIDQPSSNDGAYFVCLDGMTYIAEEPYEASSVDLNVIICEP